MPFSRTWTSFDGPNRVVRQLRGLPVETDRQTARMQYSIAQVSVGYCTYLSLFCLWTPPPRMHEITSRTFEPLYFDNAI